MKPSGETLKFLRMSFPKSSKDMHLISRSPTIWSNCFAAISIAVLSSSSRSKVTSWGISACAPGESRVKFSFLLKLFLVSDIYEMFLHISVDVVHQGSDWRAFSRSVFVSKSTVSVETNIDLDSFVEPSVDSVLVTSTSSQHLSHLFLHPSSVCIVFYLRVERNNKQGLLITVNRFRILSWKWLSNFK